MKKISALLLTIVLVGVLAACSVDEEGGAGNGENKTIKLGMVNWIDNISTANLWKFLLEEKGYDVELVELDKAAMWTGLSRGDLDLTTQVWLPLTDAALYEEYEGELTVHDTWYEGTRLGLVVPSYMEVNSIDELNGKKEELGVNEIVGIDPGSSLMQLTGDVVDQYELDYDLIEASETAMLVELKKAVKAKEPIVVTLWNPHWIFSEMDLKYLEDPKNVYGDPDTIKYMSRLGFEDDHPEVIEWMNAWDLNNEQIGTLIKSVEKAESSEEGARAWVEKNRDVVDSWFGE